VNVTIGARDHLELLDRGHAAIMSSVIGNRDGATLAQPIARCQGELKAMHICLQSAEAQADAITRGETWAGLSGGVYLPGGSQVPPGCES